MAWPPGKHIDELIELAENTLKDVRIIRHDIGQSRAIIDLEGTFKEYRIIISEIHRMRRTVRYAYYVLDRQNRVVHAFDNSPDNLAIKQKYGTLWKAHLHEEIPHQHDENGSLTLTSGPIHAHTFLKWLQNR